MIATTRKKTMGPRMSDEAVKAKTGKTWKQWFAILERAGGRGMTHQEIAAYLHTKHDVPPWWTQMVTVTFEQAAGLREKHQRPEGFQISVSRTINTSLAQLYDSVANTAKRKRWLKEDGLFVRTATKNKSMRVTWKDGKSSLEIGFSAKGKNKGQVVVQHSKLPDGKAVAKMKAYWSDALDRLRDSLES